MKKTKTLYDLFIYFLESSYLTSNQPQYLSSHITLLLGHYIKEVSYKLLKTCCFIYQIWSIGVWELLLLKYKKIKGVWQLVEILVISSTVYYLGTNIPFILLQAFWTILECTFFICSMKKKKKKPTLMHLQSLL